MENEKLQIAFRRNLQLREWKSFLDKVSKILELEKDAIQLIEAVDSLRFERNLFSKTKQGLVNGSVTRTTDIPKEQICSVIAKAYSQLSLEKVLIAPVNSMQFCFSTPFPPTPKQLFDLVTLDRDTIYVVSPDLASGIGLDQYTCESNPATCYEVDLWVPNGPVKS